MDSDDGGGNNLINLTTEEELDIVEGPSEKVTSELGADVHSFASLHTDMPLASLNEPLLMNLTEDGLESAIKDTVEKFTSFSPMMLAARIRSMQNWATTLARDQELELSRGKKLRILGETTQAAITAASVNTGPPQRRSSARLNPTGSPAL